MVKIISKSKFAFERLCVKKLGMEQINNQFEFSKKIGRKYIKVNTLTVPLSNPFFGSLYSSIDKLISERTWIEEQIGVVNLELENMKVVNKITKLEREVDGLEDEIRQINAIISYYNKVSRRVNKLALKLGYVKRTTDWNKSTTWLIASDRTTIFCINLQVI